MKAITADKPASRMILRSNNRAGDWAVAQVAVAIYAAGSARPAQLDSGAAPDGNEPTHLPPTESNAAGATEGLPLARSFETFSTRQLSIWQSAVEEAVAEQIAQDGATRGTRAGMPGITSEAVRSSSPALAATALAASLMNRSPLSDVQPLPAAERGLNSEADRGLVGTAWQCGRIAFSLAWATVNDDGPAIRKYTDELSFNVCDPLWIGAVRRYVDYFDRKKGTIPYRSGGDYVLDIQLPAKAKVAIIGDWGTGTPGSESLLRRVAEKKPDLVLHLGDIYYSGTRQEIESRFLKPYRELLGATPLYSLAGNHDMYSGGEGYYWLVDQLNQQASYFCIRNEHWQFLGLDTGFNDFNPFTVSSNVTSLTDTEAQWHRSKISEGEAKGLKTVLLSHHQLFSAYEPIGGDAVNGLLRHQFQDVFDGIAIWFWGHEHRLNLYAPYLGLQRGRCLGCSAIPVFASSDSETVRFPVPLLNDAAGNPIALDKIGAIYDHAFALMSLDGDKAEVSYYATTREAPLYSEVI